MVKILNLYSGIGGNRKDWGSDVEVTAVEYNQEIADIYKKFYPQDTVIVGDAIAYLLQHWREFDLIWSSPPCQTHSKMRYLASKRGSYDAKLPDMSLYQQILFLQHFCKDKKWVVENVVPYYEPLIKPTTKLDRHLFWSNFLIQEKSFDKPDIKHNKVTGKTDRYGINLNGIKLEHRKDQIIRNCVNPKLGKYILDSAMANITFTIKGLSKDHPAQRDFNEFMQKQKEVKSGYDANDNGIPPNNKLLGILPNEL